MLSVLLQEFPAYTVEALLAADWQALERIVEYRRIEQGIAIFNSGPDGFDRLRQHEGVVNLLLEMGKAQDQQAELSDVFDALRSQQPDKEED